MLNHLEYEPKKWVDFYKHEEDFNIKKAKVWLTKDTLPTFLYLEGNSGCGKTVFAKALIKAFNCLEREPGSVNACGSCATCKTDPSELGINNNVIWVKSSFNAGSTQQSSIKDALIQAEQGPSLRPNSNKSDVLFLVFEEAQNISKDLLQRVLAFGDVKNSITSRLCFIFITMSPEDMNSTVNQALRQRGSTCKFKKPTPTELKQFILTTFPTVSSEVAELIADESDGSYRGALNLYKDLILVDENLDEKVVTKLLTSVDRDYRFQFWQNLQRGFTYKDLREKLNNLFYFASPVRFIQQLQKDLDEKLAQDDSLIAIEDYLEASNLFVEYLLHPNVLNPVNILYRLNKKNFGF